MSTACSPRVASPPPGVSIDSTELTAAVTRSSRGSAGSGPGGRGRVSDSIAAATARSAPVSWWTEAAEGGVAPRPSATAVAVTASITSSRPTTAGHQADARRLTAVGSDMVRWNSVRRLDSARNARRRSSDGRAGGPPLACVGVPAGT